MKAKSYSAFNTIWIPAVKAPTLLLHWLSGNQSCKLYTINTDKPISSFVEGFLIVFDSRTTKESIDECITFINNHLDNE